MGGWSSAHAVGALEKREVSLLCLDSYKMTKIEVALKLTVK